MSQYRDLFVTSVVLFGLVLFCSGLFIYFSVYPTRRIPSSEIPTDTEENRVQSGQGATATDSSEHVHHGNNTENQTLNALHEESETAGNLNEEEEKLLYSLNDIDKRGEFQRQQMRQYCSRYPQFQTLPSDKHIRRIAYKHLLYDDKEKIIFCYIPKVGCSNWKRMFVVLNGILPPTPSTKRPPENILFSAKRMEELPYSQIAWRLKHYYKFMMVRNPLERLVSAYLNKIYPPMDVTHKFTFPEREKYNMLKYFEKERFRNWTKTRQPTQISPSFESYIKFITNARLRPNVHLNEHFESMTALCQPCVFDYDYYANFKYLPEDANRFMDKFGIPQFYYRDVESHPLYTTDELLGFFYGDMTPEERREKLKKLETRVKGTIPGLPSESLPRAVFTELVRALGADLDFYGSLYPEEKDYQLKYSKHT